MLFYFVRIIGVLIREQANTVLVETISGAFISKLLSISKQSTDLEWEVEEETDYSKWRDIKIDQTKKVIYVTIRKWVVELKVWLDYWEKYEEIIGAIDTTQYQLVVDCRGMPDVAQDIHILEAAERYYKAHFLEISLIFNKKQIAFMIEANQVFTNTGVKNLKIVIK